VPLEARSCDLPKQFNTNCDHCHHVTMSSFDACKQSFVPNDNHALNIGKYTVHVCPSIKEVMSCLEKSCVCMVNKSALLESANLPIKTKFQDFLPKGNAPWSINVVQHFITHVTPAIRKQMQSNNGFTCDPSISSKLPFDLLVGPTNSSALCVLSLAFDDCAVANVGWSNYHLAVTQKHPHLVKSLIWAKDQHTLH
jgi:hypothetical protein